MVNKEIRELNKEISELKTIPAKKYISGKKLSKKIENALEELEQYHNSSWGVEIYKRNNTNLNNIALYYRGNKISYEEMFAKAYQYAKSLKTMGYKIGDEIPICMSNIPEFVYLMLGASFIGAKINVVGEWFDTNYLCSILNNTNSKYIFVSDDNYESIKETIGNSNIQNIVMFSLTDSLVKDKNGNSYNPYLELEIEPQKFINKVNELIEQSTKKIIISEEFTALSNSYIGKVIEQVSLDDSFAITYTSGTTDPGCPKGCIHSNRSYITLSRFKEQDVSGMPSMRNMSVLAHIPTYTHMELSCAISDTLYEKCTLTLEPFYNRDFFLHSLLINKPNFVPASTGFWSKLCKELNYNQQYKNINLPFLMIPTVTGEGCSIGEEKFFNYTSRKHKFGTEKLPFPLAPVTFSIGGGTTESSGIFVTLFKSLQEKRLRYILHKEGLGLTPHKFVDLEVLNKNGEYCSIGEPGLLVANSPCNMMSYTDEKLNKNIEITDAYGKKWLNLGTYSYKSDSYGRIKMKGRLNSVIYTSDNQEVPYYLIEDIINKDTKNIMSVTLVKTEDRYVCHIELQPEKINGYEEVINSIMERLKNSIPKEILEVLYIKVRETFPIAPSGKRDSGSLVNEGITSDCISCSDYLITNSKQKRLIRK